MYVDIQDLIQVYLQGFYLCWGLENTKPMFNTLQKAQTRSKKSISTETLLQEGQTRTPTLQLSTMLALSTTTWPTGLRRTRTPSTTPSSMSWKMLPMPLYQLFSRWPEKHCKQRQRLIQKRQRQRTRTPSTTPSLTSWKMLPIKLFQLYSRW